MVMTQDVEAAAVAIPAAKAFQACSGDGVRLPWVTADGTLLLDNMRSSVEQLHSIPLRAALQRLQTLFEIQDPADQLRYGTQCLQFYVAILSSSPR